MVTVFVPGVFDVFHIGHLNYLRRAAEAGDTLIVGVQDDRAVLACKQIEPVVPLAERMAIIEQLRFVDEVISYIDVFQGPLLKSLNVDVFAVGEEYGQGDRYPDQRRSLAFCESRGIRVVKIPRTPHVSSTQIRGKIKEFWASRVAKEEEMPAGVTTLGSFGGDQDKVAAETRKEVSHILNAVSQPERKSILDLGCGDGRHLEFLAARFQRTVGVDFVGDLLGIARRRLDQAGLSAELVESDVTEFHSPEQFDVVLLSGITPYLDDEMASKLVANLAACTRPDTQLLVRAPIGIDARVDVINQYSADLGTRYTAFYRTRSEMRELFRRHGWAQRTSRELYQHRPDTAMWWFEYENATASVAAPQRRAA